MRRRDFLKLASHGLLAPALIGQEPAAPSFTGLTVDLGRQVPVWMREARVPGLSIVVFQNARVAWRRSFGVRDAITNAPVTDDVMFEAASMSKPVFAYVVMKLCESGVMNLDVPLTKYTPERFLAGDSRLDAITARHVMSHTSGFQNWRSDTTPLAIHFTPGTQYLYSGEGYNYLQTVVTHLLRQPFESYMRTRLFAPLGMASSGYVWDDVSERRMARPHDAAGKAIDNNKSTPASVARYGSAGSLRTTPTDFAAFVIKVVNPGAADTFSLGPESVAEMLRPQVKLPAQEFPSSWALGWQVFHNSAGDFIFHAGHNAGFHCAAVASPKSKRGYVAMTNGEGGATVLRNILTTERMQQFLVGSALGQP